MTSMPTDWLLEGEPFVKYRTLVDLLGRREDDEEVIKIRRQIGRHPLIRSIFDKRNQDGYWGTEKDISSWWPKKDTTFWMLGILADFGYMKDDENIEAACEYVFRTQHNSGAFGWGNPTYPGDCFTGILTESLANLGYTGDSRLTKAYEWMSKRQRLDGGFWCKKTALPGGPRELELGCAFATLCVLGALIKNPELKGSQVVQRGAEFLLGCWDKKGEIKYAGHDSQIGTGWEKLKYPFTDYRILKYLDVLSQIELIKDDPRIDEMVDLLMSKRDLYGRFCAESIHNVWSDFDFGQKAVPSRWITFLVYRIFKRLNVDPF